MDNTSFFVLLATICFVGDKHFGGWIFAALTIASFALP